jgi:hypothetical protein
MSPQKPPIAKSPHHPSSPIYRGIEAGGSQCQTSYSNKFTRLVNIQTSNNTASFK